MVSIRVVTGPPCSGKSSYIAEHADPAATKVDLDQLAHGLGYPASHVDWGEESPHPARVAAMIARASLVKAALTGKLRGEVWITDTVVSAVANARYAAAEVEVLSLDPGLIECLARADRDGRSLATLDQIERWYGDGAVGETSEQW